LKKKNDVVYVVSRLSQPPIRAFLTEKEANAFIDKFDIPEMGVEPLEWDMVSLGFDEKVLNYELSVHVQTIPVLGGLDFDVKILSDEDVEGKGDYFRIPAGSAPSEALFWVCVVTAESVDKACQEGVKRFKELTLSGSPLPIEGRAPDMGMLGPTANSFRIVRPKLGKGVELQC
jgi:hypothetical protein